MIWWKCWREVRTRFLFSLIMLLPICVPAIANGRMWMDKLPRDAAAYQRVIGLFGLYTVPGPLTGERLQQAWWQTALMTGLLVLPTVAYLLAGAGVITQTLWNKTMGSHSSVYFTLSLPVTRKQWLYSRALSGAVAMTVFPPLVLLIIGVGGRMAGMDIRLADGMRLWPSLWAGNLVFYCIAVNLACWFDEFWQGVAFLFLQGFLLGLVSAASPRVPNLFSFMAGGTWLYTGGSPWPGVLVCLLISAGLLALAAWAIEQREY